MSDKTSILFLCTGNSCRSQMAEGLARHYQGNLFEVYSAGIQTHGLNPNAVKVMQEIGVDISTQKSQHIDEFKDIEIDYVVTVCAHADENCPLFPAKTKVVHVGFQDPPKLAENFTDSEEKLDCYRKVRDEIKDFVMTLPQALES